MASKENSSINFSMQPTDNMGLERNDPEEDIELSNLEYMIEDEFQNIAKSVTNMQMNTSSVYDGKVYNRLDDYLEVSGDIAKLGIVNTSG